MPDPNRGFLTKRDTEVNLPRPTGVTNQTPATMASPADGAAELAFLKAVESRLEDRRTYQEFLGVMKSFATETPLDLILTRAEKLLRGHRDLIFGFNTFLPKGYKIEYPDELPAEYEKAIEFVGKMKNCFPDHHPVFRSFLEMVNGYRRGNESMEDTRRHAAVLFRDHDNLLDEFTRYYLPNDESCRLCPGGDKKGERDRKRSRDHGDSDDGMHKLSKLCRRAAVDGNGDSDGKCNPSYRRALPSRCEEILFRCDDDRCELDIPIELVKATAIKVAGLIEEMQIPGRPICIDEHLSSSNLRCIDRIYGDHGMDVVTEVMRKNPATALPVILNRLEQKHREWLSCCDDFDKIWGDIQAKNYPKSRSQ